MKSSFETTNRALTIGMKDVDDAARGICFGVGMRKKVRRAMRNGSPLPHRNSRLRNEHAHELTEGSQTQTDDVRQKDVRCALSFGAELDRGKTPMAQARALHRPTFGGPAGAR